MVFGLRAYHKFKPTVKENIQQLHNTFIRKRLCTRTAEPSQQEELEDMKHCAAHFAQLEVFTVLDVIDKKLCEEFSNLRVGFRGYQGTLQGRQTKDR